MKATKISALILSAIILALAATGCVPVSSDDTDKLTVIATIFPQYDFAKQIAGDKAEVNMLIPPGAESHSFEPTAADIIDIGNCDIFIYTGGESDTWIDGIISSANNPDITVISLLDCVDTLDEETPEGMESHEEESGAQADEHVWTSPKNAVAITGEICRAFCAKDPDNSAVYTENAKKYTDSLNELDSEFRSVAENSKRKTLVFGDRFPLLYFTKEYGLDYYAAFPGCSEDTEASAATIAFLIDKVKTEKLPVVLTIELSNTATAHTISDATGVEVKTFYSCHNIAKADFDSGVTYLELMQQNVATLSAALN